MHALKSEKIDRDSGEGQLSLSLSDKSGDLVRLRTGGVGSATPHFLLLSFPHSFSYKREIVDLFLLRSHSCTHIIADPRPRSLVYMSMAYVVALTLLMSISGV